MFISIGVFIAEQLFGYALNKKLDKFLEKTYQNSLAKLIDKTIADYAEKFPLTDKDGKFPFYKSQIIIDELLKYRFFKDNAYVLNEDRIKEELKSNANILRPKENEIKQFIELFETNLKADSELKKLAIKENYAEEVFEISQRFTPLFEQLDRLEKNQEDIKKLIEEKVKISGEIPKELTTVPRRSVSEVVGRKKDLLNLRKTLAEKHETVLMNGMGGIGKTTLAETYVQSYYDEYKHIVWVTVEENFREAVLSNFLLLRNLGLESISPEQQFEACMNTLCNLKGSNLLVIDNAKLKLASYYDLLPKAPAWQVLITSRERIDRFYIMDVDFLTLPDAIDLFKKHCKSFEDEQIEKLAKHVEFHTLTIEVLAKAAKRNKWTFEQCLMALGKDATVNVTTSRSNNEKIAKIKSYLTEIFDAAKLNEQEKWILKQFVALPPFDIEYDLLCNLLQIEKLGWADDFPSVLEGLYETGFLQKDRENETYKLHAVLNEVLRSFLKPIIKDVSFLLETVTSLLHFDDTKENPIDKFPFIPFGDAFIDVFSNSEDSEITMLKNNLALVCRDLGDYEKARNLLEAALRSDLENFGERHPYTVITKSNLATVYEAFGNYDKACTLLESSLMTNLENFGENHPNVAVNQSNLAMVYQALGNYEKARYLMEAAIKVDLENLGENHPTVANRQSNLAMVYQALGNTEKAYDLMEAALMSDRENFGEQHPSTAIRQSNLASLYQTMGDHEKARDLLEEALKSNLENFGKQHPIVAKNQSNLAMVYQALGNYEKARALSEVALKSILAKFGENHPELAIRQSNLATVYQALGDYESARDLLEAALKSDKKNLGEKHPNIAIRQSNLAMVYQDLGNYEKACDLLERALKLDLDKFGDKHPTVARVRSNLATIYQDLGDHEKARNLFEMALESDLENFSEKHPTIAIRQSNLAANCLVLGNSEKARKLWISAYEIFINALGENHPHTKTVLRFLQDLDKKRE